MIHTIASTSNGSARKERYAAPQSGPLPGSAVTPDAVVTSGRSGSQPAAAQPPHPELGAFLETGFDETRPGVNLWWLWVHDHHQTFWRVVGGSPTQWQRCLLWIKSGAPSEEPLGTPEMLIGGEHLPAVSAWQPMQPRNGEFTYVLGGNYHQESTWRWSYGLDVREDRYTGGWHVRLRFESSGQEADYNDFMVELAIVWRTGGLLGEPIEGQPVALNRDNQRTVMRFR